MPKFKFRLDSVINVKEILQKKIQKEIFLIEKEINEQKQKRQKIIEEREKTRKEVLGFLKVSMYQSTKMYDLQLEKMIQSIEKKIVLLYEKKKEKMKDLVEKKKEHKILEVLKDNQQVTFLEEEKKSELKELNEIAIRNYNGS